MTGQINDDQQLARALAELPDAPAPLSTVDISRAVHDGRTRIRRRRLAAAAAVSGLVAAATALAVLAGSLTGTAAAPDVLPATHLPRDPYVSLVGFRWLPPGFNGTFRSWARTAPGWHPLYGGGGLEAELTPPGHDRPTYSLGAGFAPNGLDLGDNHYSTTTVDGRRAYWLASGPTVTGMWNASLWWQLPDGRWLTMGGQGMVPTTRHTLPATLKADMLHAAAAFDIRPVEMPMPFFLSQQEPGFHADDLQMNTMDGGATWTIFADFSKGNYGVRLLIGTESLIDHYGGLQHLNCITKGGVKACAEPGFSGNQDRKTAADAKWAFDFMHFKYFTLLGADQKDWTTNVFR